MVSKRLIWLGWRMFKSEGGLRVLLSHFFVGLDGVDLEVLWRVWGGIVNVVINGRQ